MADKIIVLDFGSQYNQLIARRIREFGVYSELHANTMTLDEIKALGDVKGIIFSGGPNSVYDEDAFKCDPAIFEGGIPILGICYGMQMTHYMNGGNVKACETKEYGRTEITVETDSPLFKGLPKKQIVWMSHGDQVDQLADGFVKDAYSDTCTYAATSNDEKKIYTLQFHPEVRHTDYGNDILRNFVFEVCHAENNWSMHNFIDMQIEKIKETVGNDKVLLGLSGGVDSSVVAALLHKAIGDQLICMFIDHGLLRKGEGESVMETFGREMNINLVKIDAKDRFLSKLAGVTDPEQKRKIIGNEFVYTFDEEVKKLTSGEDIKWLAQGTLYTDVIESGTKTAQTIKSHHNVGGLPEDMQFKLIEPLNTLFKDEVRALGSELGLPEEMVWRQPFPGPGLGIRILSDITEEKLEIVRESDYILREEIAKAGLQRDIWQYFTALTNMRSVGVMGDQRTYDYAVAIRAVTSIDGMTADWAQIPYDVLATISSRIVNEVPHVNRVLLDITSKPPGTIEFE
ncbi:MULTISPECIES: glutamine-hydrolyzing GMP synthase [Bacillota]|jgi:GMP synthase (glutamine-hydrolysing)|uniref:GMP synthase [glutamine-hydrolyzing] n=2 Tax=Amedibacillus TaxID=2749846 RepID=A0A7G9GN97_9FIRM|nr:MULTISPECIES: glutamine-hydrolyzing GMP synthase [Erysipelotrichaceae]QNM12279.1 glutamine-hydrolyzing GMP synthase [[Eubacterium] hominis]MCH4284372.1 glutamine-hydrolyzing GMP synthase [Amedibacillus hominis]RGB57383.1 glutamine-hydrolyzing GMP synthase [Absiella sp. AM22-9]RGB59660.1 glutamine-hydrolyzing GMP synthase [Absiella sp. AM10-20]RGB66365.1 glutamine-hydrolyzing GMP synthase [Absiella sp. AM09-45]